MSALTPSGQAARRPRLLSHSSAGHHLVAGAVLPAIAPALIHLGAVEVGLAQLAVHLVVQAAQPLAEVGPSARVWLVPAYPAGRGGRWKAGQAAVPPPLPHQLCACSIRAGELGRCCWQHRGGPLCSETETHAALQPSHTGTLLGLLNPYLGSLAKPDQDSKQGIKTPMMQLYNLITIRKPHPSIPGPGQCLRGGATQRPNRKPISSTWGPGASAQQESCSNCPGPHIQRRNT